jgi:ferric-dicitrate binding protein FerR (iron transport regulator)
MQSRIHDLVIKQLKGKLSPEERIELDDFKSRSTENKNLVEKLTDPNFLVKAISLSRTLDVDAAWKKVTGKPGASTVKVRRYFVAAAAIIALACLIWLFLPWKFSKQPRYTKANPVSNEFYRAVLKKGKSYEVNTAIDTLETSYKSYYRQRLPDGSVVWLNCASSLAFPASFSGKERTVQLKGEGYFEIAKDASKPFKVQVSDMEIVVTGTKFNIKAYGDEGKIHTALFEGSVKIKTKNKIDTLNPGEQAFVSSAGSLEKTGAGSIKKTILAWKENQFLWDKEHLETIIGDICHWYGLRPVFKTNVSFGTYSAVISRERPLYQTLAILEAVTPYKYDVVGDVLIIKRH